MKNKYTFLNLCYDVLAKENVPMTPDVKDSIAIKKANKNEYDEVFDDDKYEKHIKDKKIV